MSHVDREVPRRFVATLDRLSRLSIRDYYNPYRMFAWPDSLPEAAWWMSPDLLTPSGTDAGAHVDPDAMMRLSRWESVNFYSLNVPGIRELLLEVVHRIHTPGFEVASGFFHHFLGEENEHMWFFAEFCLRYGGKIYPSPKVKTAAAGDPEVEHFLVFARILLFEEIVDFYNLRMASDDSLPDTIRQINRIHHRDESRHIAVGRELVTLLYRDLRRRLADSALREIESYLKRYIVFSLQSFYNPQAYADAGIAEPLRLRRALMADPGRRAFERKVVQRPVGFLVRTGILSDDRLPAVA